MWNSQSVMAHVFQTLRDNNQHDPSCSTRLTRPREERLDKKWRSIKSDKSSTAFLWDVLEVWGTPHRRGSEWSQCGPERGRRRVRCKSSPPASCCPSGCSHCPDSACHCLRCDNSRRTSQRTLINTWQRLNIQFWLCHYLTVNKRLIKVNKPYLCLGSKTFEM